METFDIVEQALMRPEAQITLPPRVSYPMQPKGSLSKPNSGGYSLKETLNWGEDLYKHVQVGGNNLLAPLLLIHPITQGALHSVGQKHFIPHLSYTKQSEDSRRNYLKEVRGERRNIDMHQLTCTCRQSRNFPLSRTTQSFGPQKTLP